MGFAGIWVTRMYKMSKPHSRSRFVALSGMGRDDGTKRRCRDVGMVAPYAIGKPFQVAELASLLSVESAPKQTGADGDASQDGMQAQRRLSELALLCEESP